MAERRVVDHDVEKTGAWFGDSGSFVYEFTVAGGRQYARHELDVDEGEAEVVEEPEEGATGAVRFVVEWSYGWFGRAEFSFEVFTQERPDPDAPAMESICTRVRSHSGAWFGDRGVDTLTFTIPDGRAFAGAGQPITLSGKAAVTTTPALGSTGTINLDVEWEYGWFDSARYYLCFETVPMSGQGDDVRAVLGEWRSAQSASAFVAVHMALLFTGKVLMFSADHHEHTHLAEINRGKSFLWDPETDSLEEISIKRNLFCAGHCTLGDGRLLVAGGQNTWQDVWGFVGGRLAGADKDLHTFDPVTQVWEQHADLPDPRWYPTCTTLSDGRALIFGGAEAGYWSSNGHSEVFNPTSNTLSERQEVFHDPNYPDFVYPFVHLLPNGLLLIFNVNRALIYDRQNNTIVESLAADHGGTRTYPGQGCCVPLSISGASPLTMRFLFAGGSSVENPRSDTDATRTAEIFTVNLGNPSASLWNPVADLPQRRFMSDGVLLPDGNVFLVNGAGRGKADHSSLARRKAYIFRERSETWEEVAASPRDRIYHSTAVLLPSGEVLVGGSTGHHIQEHDFSELEQHERGRVDESALDIFSPPYLFMGSRPQIQNAPTSVVHSEQFQVDCRPVDAITTVCLMRPGSTTHTNNMDQRRMVLEFERDPANELRVTAPRDGFIAPRGFYMLFVVTRDGIPSVGRFIQIR